VEARDPAFYSPAGVAAHIADYLSSHAAGAMHPCVLTSDDGTPSSAAPTCAASTAWPAAAKWATASPT
jgi:hypothetical protein